MFQLKEQYLKVKVLLINANNLKVNMKKVLLFFCFYVILSALGLGQSQICYNDHERIFVLGVRYFKEPVLVIEKNIDVLLLSKRIIYRNALRRMNIFTLKCGLFNRIHTVL